LCDTFLIATWTFLTNHAWALRRPRPGGAPARHRGQLGAVTLEELTARQVHKALAGLPASPPARSLRPRLLSTRLTRSLPHG
jgi:hypothetical protein